MNSYPMYNSLQTQYDMLAQRKLDTENAMARVQGQMSQQMGQPPIQFNVNTQQPSASHGFSPFQNNVTFDFNGMWVKDFEEAKKVMGANLPLMLLDQEQPLLYVRDLQGNFKIYELTEKQVQPEKTADDKLDSLEAKFNDLSDKFNQLLGALSTPQEAQNESTKKRNTKTNTEQQHDGHAV